MDGGSRVGEALVGEADIEFLLNQAQQALSSIDDAKDTLPAGVARFELSDFSGTPASSEAATLDLVRDVELDVNIELGRTHMHLEDVLRLKRGSVVPLDKLAGDPVDIYVNDRLIARGEVLVLNDNFCVRVAELVVGDGTQRH
jgi:flagellar motor switch protein FliN/FliY